MSTDARTAGKSALNSSTSEMHYAVPTGAETFSTRCVPGFNSLGSRKGWPRLQLSEAFKKDSCIHGLGFRVYPSSQLPGRKHYVLEAPKPLNPKPLKPSTINPKPSTRNPKPLTLRIRLNP